MYKSGDDLSQVDHAKAAAAAARQEVKKSCSAIKPLLAALGKQGISKAPVICPNTSPRRVAGLTLRKLSCMQVI